MKSAGKVTAAEFPVWMIFFAIAPMIADKTLDREVIIRSRGQDNFGLEESVDNQRVAPLLQLIKLFFRKNRVVDLIAPVLLFFFDNNGDL